ncbi:MAG: hypothetical protein A2W91_05270 [Bacteroidetes bacterium GWF2_38_335]|nr:MAG: hypothetical protein A2W91_05270 [Bacteroidetes bacterium GWF2_38_335]OFY79760.1 MAG: hypothetical protein A2281_10150 [Bacteroidetes bacterium RIFOXYA12_FULL_38_20]HBS88147.1 hypothetical protein [Bacteroidales bacterium]
MKNLTLLIVAIFAISFILPSCGGGLEGDVKALAEKRCECKKLDGDDKDKCKDELDEMEEGLEKKVKDMDKGEQEKLEKVYKETYEACKEKDKE